MRILVTNDDGVSSPGLWALARELDKVGQVLVVAPNRDMSGTSASLMLRRPIRTRRIRPPRGLGHLEAHAVNGTPATCALLALRGAVGGGIDLVVSGINSGPNLGRDALLSGTVGAAFMGAIDNVPSIAVSITGGDTWHWEPAATVAARLARRLDGSTPAGNILINVNLPNRPAEELAGVRITRLAHDSCLTRLSVLPDDGRSNAFRFAVTRQIPRTLEEGSDEWAVANRFVSLTLLLPDVSFDLADPRLASWAEGLLPLADALPVAAASPA